MKTQQGRSLSSSKILDQPTANATWSRVQQDLLTVNTYLYSQNYTKLSTIGFCWGGLRVMKACGNGNNNSWSNTPYFTCISIHGSQLNVADAEVLQAPMLFIRAGNDPPFDNITSVLNQKPFGSKCEYKVYENMRHGFVSAGANYSDPANVAAIDDVHQTVRTYLSKILNDSSTNTSTSSPSSLNSSSTLSSTSPSISPSTSSSTSSSSAFFFFSLNSLFALCKQRL